MLSTRAFVIIAYRFVYFQSTAETRITAAAEYSAKTAARSEKTTVQTIFTLRFFINFVESTAAAAQAAESTQESQNSM